MLKALLHRPKQDIQFFFGTLSFDWSLRFSVGDPLNLRAHSPQVGIASRFGIGQEREALLRLLIRKIVMSDESDDIAVPLVSGLSRCCGLLLQI